MKLGVAAPSQVTILPRRQGSQREVVRPSVRVIRRARSGHGTGTRARCQQDIESDTGYDTRRRALDGALARLSQTTVYDTC